MNRIHFISQDTVTQLYNSIITPCTICGGTGANLLNYVFSECSCVKEFKRQVSFIGAGIPRKYWDFSLDHLLPRFQEENKLSLDVLRKFCGNINQSTGAGIGLYIQGVSGVAKTSLAFYILKEALAHDIPSYGIRLSQLTKLIYESTMDDNKKDYLNFIKNETKLLMIDEIEKDFSIDNTAKFMGSQVNDFFSAVYDSQKSLIVTSNVPKEELTKVHAFNIIDRLQELIDVIFVGESFRGSGNAFQKLMGS